MLKLVKIKYILRMRQRKQTIMYNNINAFIKVSAINSLWPSDAIWQSRSESTLAQVIVCCLSAPSHYLNQCWLGESSFTFTWEQIHSASAKESVLPNEFENYTWEITATYHGNQSINIISPFSVSMNATKSSVYQNNTVEIVEKSMISYLCKTAMEKPL